MTGIPQELNPSALPPPDSPDPLHLGSMLAKIASDPNAPAWAKAIGKSSEVCAERRARLLRYPDLTKRLVTELGYTKPEQWNGYIPPRPDAYAEREILHDTSGYVNPDRVRTPGQQVNDSPRRAALVDIAAEAMRRESASDEVPKQEAQS